MAPPASSTALVTVVVPVWDAYAGPALAQALDSIRVQRPRPRILVVNNASSTPVDVPEDVDLVAAEHRLSVGAARNLGVEHARTPWVMLWDADDLMLPGTIADLLAGARDDVVAVATSILDDRTGVRHHWPRTWTAPLARLPRAYAVLHSVSSLFPTTGALLRTDAARSGGGFADADGGDDWVVGVSVALRGRVVLRRRLGRVYRHHRGSISDGWTGRDDIVIHASLVRARIASDPATPPAVRRLLPAIAAAQWLVIHVLRPTSRRLPRRRRELAAPAESLDVTVLAEVP